jgi:hypothetical protein
MEYAFLYLTYNEPNKSIKYLIKKGYNIYIHSKNKINKYKEYVIPNIIETEWGQMSIVNAEINLLKEAYKNNNNKYFILCSEDCFLLHSNIEKYINKKYSMFSFIKQYNNFYKTEQWWILIRNDVKVILATEHKYTNIFNNIKLNGVPDENYFLTILQKENTNYKYINSNYMYTSWLKLSVYKHPKIFNKLTKYDIIDIQKKKSLFIRKVTANFTLNKYVNNKILYIVLIGTETNYINYLLENDLDFIIVTSLKINNINSLLLKKCICIYSIIFKFYNKFIKDICITHKKYLLQWDKIYFIPEIFNFNDINMVNKLKIIDKNNL